MGQNTVDLVDYRLAQPWVGRLNAQTPPSAVIDRQHLRIALYVVHEFLSNVRQSLNSVLVIKIQPRHINLTFVQVSAIRKQGDQPIEKSRIKESQHSASVYLAIKFDFLEFRGLPQFAGRVVDYWNEVQYLYEAAQLSRVED